MEVFKTRSIMSIRGVILIMIIALFLTLPLFAREKTDVIVMKNGDRFTGEVKGLNGGVLAVDLDYVDGTISLQWSAGGTTREQSAIRSKHAGRHRSRRHDQDGGGRRREPVDEN